MRQGRAGLPGQPRGPPPDRTAPLPPGLCQRAWNPKGRKPLPAPRGRDRLFQLQPLPKGPVVSEDDIRLVLEQTGRARSENQLNCGACGYASCRDEAEAVLLGMAEREMCIPYMRRQAEQRSNRIMETSPNGIVVLDKKLAIHDANPAFEKLFHSVGPKGLPISHFTDPEPFERLASGQSDLF